MVHNERKQQRVSLIFIYYVLQYKICYVNDFEYEYEILLYASY
jgi:hypothetical protein